MVDDNYAWEVWQMANRYPAQKDVSDMLETVNLSGERDLAQHQEAASAPPASPPQAAPETRAA